MMSLRASMKPGSGEVLNHSIDLMINEISMYYMVKGTLQEDKLIQIWQRAYSLHG